MVTLVGTWPTCSVQRDLSPTRHGGRCCFFDFVLTHWPSSKNIKPNALSHLNLTPSQSPSSQHHMSWVRLPGRLRNGSKRCSTPDPGGAHLPTPCLSLTVPVPRSYSRDMRPRKRATQCWGPHYSCKHFWWPSTVHDAQAFIDMCKSKALTSASCQPSEIAAHPVMTLAPNRLGLCHQTATFEGSHGNLNNR